MAAKWLAEGEFDQVQPPLARRNYGDLKSLHAAYSANGYGRADTIPHRLMVTVLDHYLEDLKVARIAAEGKRQYRLAQELTNRFNEAKKQFREKQEWQVKDQQRQEVKQMEQAEKIMSTTFKSTWNNKHEDTLLENEERKKILEQKQERENRELEKTIRRLPPPVASMSKELVGYVALEEHMRKNGQYSDAIQLYKKIQKLAPQEQRAAEEKHAATIQKMRQKLEEQQEEEKKSFYEWSKANLIKIRDGRVIASKVNKQSIRMHSEALNHALTLEMIEPAGWKRTVKPTVAKRAHYEETTSTKRGTQVLASVSHGRLHAPTLCGMHEFKNEPECMISFDEYETLKWDGGVQTIKAQDLASITSSYGSTGTI